MATLARCNGAAVYGNAMADGYPGLSLAPMAGVLGEIAVVDLLADGLPR